MANAEDDGDIDDDDDDDPEGQRSGQLELGFGLEFGKLITSAGHDDTKSKAVKDKDKPESEGTTSSAKTDDKKQAQDISKRRRSSAGRSRSGSSHSYDSDEEDEHDTDRRKSAYGEETNGSDVDTGELKTGVLEEGTAGFLISGIKLGNPQEDGREDSNPNVVSYDYDTDQRKSIASVKSDDDIDKDGAANESGGAAPKSGGDTTLAARLKVLVASCGSKSNKQDDQEKGEPLSEPKPKKPYKCPKFHLMNTIFFIFNIFLCGFGMMVLVVGIIASTTEQKLGVLTWWDPSGRLQNVNMARALKGSVFGLVTTGLYLICLGVLGVAGFFLASKEMLHVYAALSGVAVGSQLGFMIYVLVLKSSMRTAAKLSMYQNLKTSYEGTDDSTNLFSQFMDLTQAIFACCAVRNWTDFEGSPWYMAVNNLSCFDENGFPLGQAFNTSAAAGLANATSVNGSSSSNITDPACINVTLELFPRTCCATTSVQLTNVIDKDKLHLRDPDCPINPPGKDNPNTATPCFDALNDWMVNKVNISSSFLFSLV